MVAVTGTGSGLDIDGLVASLVAAERLPAEARLNVREADLTTRNTVFSSAKSAVADFEIATNKLADPITFSQFIASSSDDTKATISTTSAASLGSYQLAISALASAQTLASGSFSATTDTIGTGTLTISLGTPSYTGNTPDSYASFTQASSVEITIDSSNNTLSGVKDAINASGAGVTASILKNGSNYQLMLVSESTGLANSIAVSVSGDSTGTDTDSSGLSQLVYSSSANQLQQYSAGSDASFSINGLAVTSTSNTVSDVIDGVTLNLLSTTTSALTIDVKTDTQSIVDDVQAFVDKYNSYSTLLTDLTAYDSVTGTSGALQGDWAARSIMTKIRSTLSEQVVGLTGSYRSLTDVGISVDKSGVMSFDQSAFKTAFAAAPTDVSGVFSKTTVSGVSVEGVAEKLETLMEGFLASGGIFDTRTSNLSNELREIALDRADLARRMESLETRYLGQLNAMDSLLAEIETTGNFLTQQFEAMKPKKD